MHAVINARRSTEATAFWLWVVYAGAILAPKFRTQAFAIGAEDFLALLGLPLVACWILRGALRDAWRFKTFFSIWILIIATGIFLGLVHSAYLLDDARFPGEIWQYVKRMVYFVIGMRLIHAGLIEPGRAMRVLVLVFFAMNVIGILQVFAPTAELLSVVYSQTETQLEALVGRAVDTTRNYSVAGFSTSWGGLSAFMLALSVAFWVYGRGKRLLDRPLTFVVLATMSLLNVFLSGSRAAMLSVAVMIPALLGLLLVGRGRRLERFSRIVLIILGAAGIAAVLLTVFAERVSFIQYRNEALVEAYFAGANRFGDAQTALNALSNLYYWIFGVGNAVQRAHYVEYGVEVEPIFLLVNYGVTGLVLRYFLLWLVVRRSWTLYQLGDSFHPAARALGVAGLLGVASYVVFSSGYFFFHESAVGTLAWLFFGAIVGLQPVGPLLRAETRLHWVSAEQDDRGSGPRPAVYPDPA